MTTNSVRMTCHPAHSQISRTAPVASLTFKRIWPVGEVAVPKVGTWIRKWPCLLQPFSISQLARRCPTSSILSRSLISGLPCNNQDSPLARRARANSYLPQGETTSTTTIPVITPANSRRLLSPHPSDVHTLAIQHYIVQGGEGRKGRIESEIFQ